MPRESSKSSRSSKTNKTSHVLSLLTNDGEAVEELTSAPEAEPPVPEAEKPAPAPKTAKPASRSRKKKTVQPEPPAQPEKMAQPDDQTIASEIRNALEDALKAEEAEEAGLPQAAEAPAPVREQTPEPVPEPASQAEAPAQAEPLPFDLPSFDPEPLAEEIGPFAPEMVMPEAAEEAAPQLSGMEPEPEESASPPSPEAIFTSSAPESAFTPPPAPEPPKAAPRPVTETAAVPDEEPFCFNVMEALVESKAEKYIDLFGLCPCSRCRTDVVALALTRLPAKYVVATRADLVPLLSVYEGRYNAAVVSQVMRACNRVADQPRHKKP